MTGYREHSGRPFDERVLTSSSFSVVFDCSEDSLHTVGLSRSSNGRVGGLAPKNGRICGTHPDCVQLQLLPLVAAAVLDVSPAELSGQLIAVDDLWGADAQRASAQLLETRSWDERFAVIQRLVESRLQSDRRLDPEVADAWRRIEATGGRLPIADLAADYGWSRTRLWLRFSAQVGERPKRAASVVRFDRALRLISAGRDLASVAAECGFADQSHLTRDFVDMTNATPATFQADPLWTLGSSGGR